jgi:uncharacterized repeat protein (TIGR01451 family)
MVRRVCFLGLLLCGLMTAPRGEADGPGPTPSNVRRVAPPALPVPPGVPASLAIDPPAPMVSLRVRVPAEAAAGRELTYRIIAENTSLAAAHHVTVRIPLPAGSRFVRATPEPTETKPALLWKFGSLAPRARRKIALVVVPDGGSDLSCCARVQFEHGQCVRTRVLGSRPPGVAPSPPAVVPPAPPPRPTPAPPSVPVLQLRKAGPKSAARYDMLSYKLVVSNTGRATAKNVVVEEALPEGLDFANSKPSTSGDNPLVWKLGDLAPGAAREVEYQAIAKVRADKAILARLVTLECKALVRADGGLKRELVSSVRVGQPSFAIEMLGPKQRFVGRPATFLITVSNPGSWPATNIQLVDELPQMDSRTPAKPSGLLFLEASEGGQFVNNEVRWNLGTLVAGESRTVRLTIRASRAGTLKNVCIGTADRGLIEQGLATTEFDSPSGLEIDKERDKLTVGQETTVTLRIYHGGKPGKAALKASATLPEGLQLVEVKEPPGSTVAGQKIDFPEARDFAAGQERRAILRVRATKPGSQRIDVEARAGALAAKGDETVPVLPAGLP